VPVKRLIWTLYATSVWAAIIWSVLTWKEAWDFISLVNDLGAFGGWENRIALLPFVLIYGWALVGAVVLCLSMLRRRSRPGA
jgi:hypothetical protein